MLAQHSLDGLWFECETIGRPELKRAIGRERKYEASIMFETKGRSFVNARGIGESPVAALEAALKEAQALYAGYMLANTP